jgi:hypothetical protein
MMGTARRAMLFLAVAGFTLSGCGTKELPHAKVHGKVTFQGKPLTFGSVMFFPVESPKDGPLQGASGDITPEGTYELKSQTTGGALLGEHKVVVYAVDIGKSSQSSTTKGDAPGSAKGTLKSILPQKYSDMSTTPLVYKVVDGDNTFDIEIKN